MKPLQNVCASFREISESILPKREGSWRSDSPGTCTMPPYVSGRYGKEGWAIETAKEEKTPHVEGAPGCTD